MLKLYISGTKCASMIHQISLGKYLVEIKMKAQITKNVSIIEKYGTFKQEPGLKIKFLDISPDYFLNNVWNFIKETFDIHCAYVKYKPLCEKDISDDEATKFPNPYEGCFLGWEELHGDNVIDCRITESNIANHSPISPKK